MKAIFKIITLTLVISLSACKEEKKVERTPARVRITNVSCNSGSTDTYSGIVEEETGSAISFQIPGTIEHLPVHVGQYVKTGQLIASVNPATLQNTYNAAVATLTQARDAYERMKQLHERGSIPEIQWVEVQSKLSQAESSERIAKKESCGLPIGGTLFRCHNLQRAGNRPIGNAGDAGCEIGKNRECKCMYFRAGIRAWRHKYWHQR